MVYYHGSNVKFQEFDLSKGGGRLCLTPHLEYAKHFGRWIYVVSVEGCEDVEWREWMNNITFASLDKIKIIDIIENEV